MSRFRLSPLAAVLTLALAGALAGCGGDEPPGNREVPARPVPSPPAPPTPVPSPSPVALPEEMVGSWDASIADCARDASEMRLVVSPEMLRFYEAVAEIQAVGAAEGGAVDVDAITSSEGITEQRRYRLRLNREGGLAVTAGGATVTRVRCPADG